MTTKDKDNVITGKFPIGRILHLTEENLDHMIKSREDFNEGYCQGQEDAFYLIEEEQKKLNLYKGLLASMTLIIVLLIIMNLTGGKLTW